MGMGRSESSVAPIADGIYTIYAVEAKVYVATTGSIGINFRFKINELDEIGQAQAAAGKTFFATQYPTEKTMGWFCSAIMDPMDFPTVVTGHDENGKDVLEYQLPDGSEFPDIVALVEAGELKKDDTLPYFIGIPFVTKLSGKDNTNPNNGKVTYQYTLNGVTGKDDDGQHVVIVSVHPSKIAAYTNNPASPSGGAGSFGASLGQKQVAATAPPGAPPTAGRRKF